jgi:hypothetical protein
MYDDTRIATKRLKKTSEAISGTHTVIYYKGICTWNITHNTESTAAWNWRLSGGDHRWFRRRNTRKRRPVTRDMKKKTTTTTTTTTIIIIIIIIRIKTCYPSWSVYLFHDLFAIPRSFLPIYTYERHPAGNCTELISFSAPHWTLIMKCLFLIAKRQKYLVK